MLTSSAFSNGFPEQDASSLEGTDSAIVQMTLINRLRKAFAEMGVRFRIVCQTDLWRILLEATSVPNQRECVSVLGRFLMSYEAYPTVEVFARSLTEPKPAWGVRIPAHLWPSVESPHLENSHSDNQDIEVPPPLLAARIERSSEGQRWGVLNSPNTQLSPLNNPSQFNSPPATPEAPETPVQKIQARRSWWANGLVILAGLGFLGFAGTFLYTNATTVRSRDAVINGVLVGVRAPEDGILIKLRGNVGDIVHPLDGPVAVIQNDRASRMEPKIINTWLQKRRGELGAEQEKLQQLQGLVASVQADAQNQSRLEVRETSRLVAAAQASLQAAQDNLSRAKADLEGAKARERLAKVNDKRYSELATQGAVAQALADGARAEVEQSQANVTSRARDVDSAAAEVQRLTRNLEAVEAENQAAELGLTLRNTRSQFDPRLRLQDLQRNLQEQAALVRGIQQEIKSKEAELTQAQQELQQRIDVPVAAPITGIVWQHEFREGMQIQKNEQIMQILDCDRRWVDVFVDEKYIRLIHPGMKATIELYGGANRRFRATVTKIRSGLGRLNPGEDLVIPIPENYPRQTQVRVTFDSAGQKSQGNFCYVGYTARVVFDVQR